MKCFRYTFFFLLLSCLVLHSCKSFKTTTIAATPLIPADAKHTGSSFADAIIVEEQTESKGVAAEYAWVNAHYPNCRIMQHVLRMRKGKPYDMLTIKLSPSKVKQLYFDISNFYGKV